MRIPYPDPHTARLSGAYVRQCPHCREVCAYWDAEDLDDSGRLWHDCSAFWVVDVCTDCYMASAGYRPDDTGTAPDCEPLGTIGVPWWDVNAGCDCETSPDGEPTCGSEHGFSWSPCPGCGSHLGGDRYPVTVSA